MWLEQPGAEQLKTVEINLRQRSPTLPSITRLNSTESAVETFRFLGSISFQDLKWAANMNSHQAQQRMSKSSVPSSSQSGLDWPPDRRETDYNGQSELQRNSLVPTFPPFWTEVLLKVQATAQPDSILLYSQWEEEKKSQAEPLQAVEEWYTSICCT